MFTSTSDPYQEVFLCTSIMGFITDIHTKRCTSEITPESANMKLFIFISKVNMGTLPSTHNTFSVLLESIYLAEYPGLPMTLIWKVVFLPILVLFHWFICLCVCISVIKLIIVVPRKPSWKSPILMWICFLNVGVYPRLLLISIWEVEFWTVSNCDSHKLRHYRRNLWFVAICVQSPDGINWVQ